MTETRHIHQFLGNAGPGNSISAGAQLLCDALREWGYTSELYAETVAPASAWGDVRHFRRYHPHPADVLILHYTQASALADYVRTLACPLILIYHNVTPARFFVGANPDVVATTQRGLAELATFRAQTVLALAVSAFNRSDLIAAGYTRTAVVPLIIPETLRHTAPDAAVLNTLADGVNLLCVGRIAPNKRYEDVIKVLYYYRQIEPAARLFLVGHTEYTGPYVAWLRQLIAWLGLEDAVTFTGHISDAALAAYYRRAAAFLYMSEHEGFGMPLIESMRFDVPVVAYAGAAIPETLGGAGLLVREKHFPVVAEALHLLQTDAALRAQILARQRARAQDFAPATILAQLRAQIEMALEPLSGC
jgi:glycosyltransferase involved in cell wall biosynthesis